MPSGAGAITTIREGRLTRWVSFPAENIYGKQVVQMPRDLQRHADQGVAEGVAIVAHLLEFVDQVKEQKKCQKSKRHEEHG